MYLQILNHICIFSAETINIFNRSKKYFAISYQGSENNKPVIHYQTRQQIW